MADQSLFSAFLEADSEFVHELEDAEDVQRILDELVRHRKSSGLRQSDVAKRMKVSQPRVSDFESESSDPRLATVQRYARAVGVRLRLKVEYPAAHVSFDRSRPRSYGWKRQRGSAHVAGWAS